MSWLVTLSRSQGAFKSGRILQEESPQPFVLCWVVLAGMYNTCVDYPVHAEECARMGAEMVEATHQFLPEGLTLTPETSVDVMR